MTVRAPWTCGCCGRRFEELPLDVAFGLPDEAHALAEGERAARLRASSDFCRLDGRAFVRACLEIPVPEVGAAFNWGVWVEATAEVADRAAELFDRDADGSEPEAPVVLANAVPGHEGSLGSACRLRFRTRTRRPLVLAGPGCASLAAEQREGMPLARVHAVARMFTRH